MSSSLGIAVFIGTMGGSLIGFGLACFITGLPKLGLGYVAIGLILVGIGYLFL